MPVKSYATAETLNGLRESRINALKTLDYEDYPFISLIGDDVATNPTHYYQTRVLPAPNLNNFNLDGAAITYSPSTSFIASSNKTAYCQLLINEVAVGFRADAVDKAGIGKGKLSSYNDQKALKMRQAKKDLEAIALSSQAGVASLDDAGTEGKMDGARNIITVANGCSVIDAAGAPYATNGQLSETMYNDLSAQIWRKGGKPPYSIVSEYGQRCINAFGYNHRRTQDVGGKRASFIVDNYTTSFGRQDIVLDPYLYLSGTTETLLMIQPEYWKFAFLQALFFTEDYQNGTKTSGFWTNDVTLVNLAPGAAGKITNIARSSDI